MKQGIYTVSENRTIAPGLTRLVLAGDTSAFTAPGQFLNIKIPGLFLRRPISVSDWDEKTVTVIYKTVGEGTKRLAAMQPGKTLDVLTGLGNGFDISPCGKRPLLVGGGVGSAPMYRLARELIAGGKTPVAVLGFARAEDVFYEKELRALGAEVIVTTEDGSAGIKGFVTDGIAAAGAYSHIFACGPTAMLRALEKAASAPGQYSLEERMGCGFGACMGCSIETKNGAKRVCKDGPVFRREEILW